MVRLERYTPRCSDFPVIDMNRDRVDRAAGAGLEEPARASTKNAAQAGGAHARVKPARAHRGRRAVRDRRADKLDLARERLHVLHPRGGRRLRREVRLRAQVGLVKTAFRRVSGEKRRLQCTYPSRCVEPAAMAAFACAVHWLVWSLDVLCSAHDGQTRHLT
jgi:hypothetical protein